MDSSTSITTKYSDRHPSPLSKSEGKETPNGAKISTGEQLLAEGSKIHARITDFVGKQLTLKLDDGTTVTANTSAGTHLAIGQSADFEVLRSTSDQLLIKLLSGSNESTSGSMAGRALLAAGLPVTEENASLVNTLLDNLLPVNQESLQTLAKDMKMFPGADPTVLAKMRQNGLPLNSRTIAQYEAYANYEHQLMPKLSDLASVLDSADIAALLEEAGFEFTEPGEGANGAGNAASAGAAGEGAGANGVAGEGAGVNGNGLAAEGALAGANGANGSGASGVNSASGEGAAANGVAGEGAGTAGASGVAGEGAGAEGASGVAGEGAGTNSAGVNGAGANGTGAKVAGAVGANGTDANASGVNGAGANASGVNSASANGMNSATGGVAGEAAGANGASDANGAEQGLDGTSSHGAASHAVSKEAAEKFLSRWSLSPKDLLEPNSIENMYERLNNDLKTLSKALGSIKEKHPEAGAELQKMLENTQKSVENLKDNLEFMNTLNRYFPYVQLPVRLKDSFTQGELYVYKRNHAKKADGNASVLLRLDMEHLGQTDIYLNLSGQNLTTKFYLGDEAATLVSEHAPELQSRLENLGFTVNCEILPREESKDPVHEFLATTSSTDTKHYRFDRKA